MEISLEAVVKLADLARLELSADEAERMHRDLETILAYVGKLAELETSGVPPTSHVLEFATPQRPDEVSGQLPVEEAVRNAPEHDDASMIVPKVIE